MGQWTYFSDDEVRGLKDELCAKLDQARGLAGIPFVLTSTLRTVSENESIPGAVQDSSHLAGLAADISTPGSSERFKILKALLMVGFVRIGVYSDGHVHADIDETKPQQVIWVN